MPSKQRDNEIGYHRDGDNVKRRSDFDDGRTDAFKEFVLSEQTALKRSDNEQRLPWTALKLSAFAGGF